MIDLDLFLIPHQGDWRVTLETVRLLEASRFNCVWVPDSPPTHWRDPYVTMALCARETSRIKLGTGVTNPVTRHESVTAGAIANIEHLAPGRAILGIGAGDAAVRAIGLKPATMDSLAAYIAAVRRLLRERGVSVPVYLSASGPRALDTAGKVADGVLISVGMHPGLMQKARERVRRGAEEAGRDPGAVQITFVAHFALSHDESEAKRAARPMAARKALDLEWHAKFLESELGNLRVDAKRVSEAYDFRRHFDSDAPHNEAVSEALIDALVVAGTPETCLKKIRAMEKNGVASIAFFPSGSRRQESIEILAREVIPSVQ